MSALRNGDSEDIRPRKQRNYMPLRSLDNRRAKHLLMQHPIMPPVRLHSSGDASRMPDTSSSVCCHAAQLYAERLLL